MSQHIDGDRAIPGVKIGLLMVPETVVCAHLMDKDERHSLSLDLIRYRKIVWTSHDCVTMSKNMF